MDYQSYLKAFDENKSFECMGGVDHSIIKSAEEILGISFPHEYRTYLNQCGSIGFGDEFIFGLFHEYDNETTTGSVVMETKKYREEIMLPEEYVVLECAEDENILVQKVKDNDCRDSEIFSIDLMKGSLVYTKLYDSFEEYFKDFVGDISK